MDQFTQLVELFATNILLDGENETRVESFKKRYDTACAKESGANVNSSNLDAITLEQIEVLNSDLLVVHEPFVVFLGKPINQIQEQTKQLNDAADDLEEYLQQLESLCAKYSSEIVSIEEDLALNAKFKEEVVCGTYDKQGNYVPAVEVVQPIYDEVFNVQAEKTFVDVKIFGKSETIPFDAELFSSALCSWLAKGKLSKFIYQKIIASFETMIRELETKEQRIYYINTLWWIIKILEERSIEKCEVFQTIHNPSERKDETSYGRFVVSLQQLLFRMFTDFTVDICNTSFAPLLSLMKEESTKRQLIGELTEWENFFVEQNTPLIVQRQFAGQFIIFISYSTFNDIAVRSQTCTPELGIYVKLNLSNLVSWLQRNQFDDLIVYIDPLSQAANAISLMNTELLCDNAFSSEAFPSLNRAQVLTLAAKICRCKGEIASKIEAELLSPRVSKMSIMMDPFAEANIVQSSN